MAEGRRQKFTWYSNFSQKTSDKSSITPRKSRLKSSLLPSALDHLPSEQSEVKQHYRMRNGKLILVKAYRRQKEESKRSDAVAIAVGVGVGSKVFLAGVLGLSVNEYYQLKAKRSNILNNLSRQIKYDAEAEALFAPLKETNQELIFFYPGLTPKDKFDEGELFDFFESNLRPNLQQPDKFLLRVGEFNYSVPEGIDFAKNPTKYVLEASKTFERDINTIEAQKRLLKEADRLYTYSQMFPDKPIYLLGHSAGGIYSRNLGRLLGEKGVKNVNIITIGSVNFGLTDLPENVKEYHFFGTQDALKLMADKKSEYVAVKGHYLPDYFKSGVLKKRLKEIIK